MREIKFRYVLKNKHTKKIHYKWYYLSQIEQGLNTLFNIDDYEIISRDQYIGREDKKESEIYDWDIVKVHVFTQELGENMGVMEGEKEFIAEISLEDLSIGVVLVNGENNSGSIWAYDGMHEESLEVIGNIHEGIKGGGES